MRERKGVERCEGEGERLSKQTFSVPDVPVNSVGASGIDLPSVALGHVQV